MSVETMPCILWERWYTHHHLYSLCPFALMRCIYQRMECLSGLLL